MRRWASCSANRLARDGPVGGGLPGKSSPQTWDAVEKHGAPYALYVVTDHEGVPWEDDGLRWATNAGVHDRTVRAGAERAQLPWIKVTGSHQERMEQMHALIARFYEPKKRMASV